MARQVPRYEGVRGRGRASHTVRVNNLTLQRRVGTRKSKRRGGRARRCLDGRWLAVAGHRLRLAQVRHLEAGLVLGQDLHEGPQLQPPLLAGDPVPVEQTEHAAGEAAPTGARQGPVPTGLGPAAMAPLGRPAAPLPQCCGSLRGGRQHRPRRSGRLAPRPRHEGVDVRGFVYLLEVCLLLQLYHGPEHKVSLGNAQHADGLIGHEPFPCKRRDQRLEARGRSAVRPTAAGGRGDNDSSSSSHLSRRTPDARLPAAVTRGRRATWESP